MKNVLFSFLIMSVIIIASCKEENEPPACVAGTGGTASFLLLPEHHGDPIYNATAYIEFNTQTNPGALSNYDLVAHGHNEHIHVEDLKCGEYFIYCEGYDSSIAMPVRGGIPFVIQRGVDGEITVHVPVTE